MTDLLVFMLENVVHTLWLLIGIGLVLFLIHIHD
jgi:hypothetical protein